MKAKKWTIKQYQKCPSSSYYNTLWNGRLLNYSQHPYVTSPVYYPHASMTNLAGPSSPVLSRADFFSTKEAGVKRRKLMDSHTGVRPEQKYQRTRSFDESCLNPQYFRGRFQPPGITVYPSQPCIYPAPTLRKASEDSAIYRSPIDFCANSYMGWHQASGMHPIADGEKETHRETSGDQLFTSRPSYGVWNAPYQQTAGPNAVQDTYLPIRNEDKTSASVGLPSSIADSAGAAGHAGARSKWKLLLILSLLVIVIGVLVAMGIAVYSQVKTHNSVMKLLREQTGSFLVTDGIILDFNPQLLTPDTRAFRRKAFLFEQKINGLFDAAGFSAVYEGSEIVSFAFVVSVPAMQVNFKIKSKVNANLQPQDIIAMFQNGIKKNVRNLFSDIYVDLNSITIEGQKSNQLY